MPAAERVRYKTFDGLEIPAFLFRPEHPNGAAVVYPHGGPRAQYVLEWDPLVQYLVLRGYTVLANNYRGSTGYGLEYEQLNDYGWGDWRYPRLFVRRPLPGRSGRDRQRPRCPGGRQLRRLPGGLRPVARPRPPVCLRGFAVRVRRPGYPVDHHQPRHPALPGNGNRASRRKPGRVPGRLSFCRICEYQKTNAHPARPGRYHCGSCQFGRNGK